MAAKIKLIVNAIPLANISTGISRYMRCLYEQLGKRHGRRLEIAYFDGRKLGGTMPRGPRNIKEWSRAVDLFWKLPPACALPARLALHACREIHFSRLAGGFDLYHEAGFFPFAPTRGLKTVFTIHDLSMLRFPEHHPGERILYSRLFFRRRSMNVSEFIAVSDFTGNEIRDLLAIPGERITVTPLAHSPETFRPASPYRVREFRRRNGLPEKYFLFVGSGDPRKNLDLIPEALEISGLHAPLAVIGWTGWADATHSSRIIPLGYLSDEELAAAYSGATALVLPSSYEGFGLPVLEAMACGCPVITARRASLPEVAGDAALLVDDPRDPRELSEQLLRVHDTPSLGRALRKKGFDNAAAFSWEETADRTFEAFEKALAHG